MRLCALPLAKSFHDGCIVIHHFKETPMSISVVVGKQGGTHELFPPDPMTPVSFQGSVEPFHDSCSSIGSCLWIEHDPFKRADLLTFLQRPKKFLSMLKAVFKMGC